MKKNDLVLLAVIVLITVIISFVIGDAIIGEPKSKPVAVDKAVAIEENFPLVDQKTFSDKSIDPTVNISIGNQTDNTSPFSAKAEE